MDEYLGMIKLFAGDFAPKGWAFCNGAMMSVSQNAALFSLLGTTYGGNGSTTFGLPDLRGRTPLCYGQGPGLQNIVQGEMAGTENVTLIAPQIPAHTHTLNASTTAGNAPAATDALLAVSNGSTDGGDSITGLNYLATNPTTILAQASIGAVGGQGHENRPPFMALNYIICLNGLYPSRP